MSSWAVPLSAQAVLVLSLSLAVPVADAAHVEERAGLRIAYLAGSPYELGRQHGELLREEVRASVGTVLGYFRGYLKLPLLGPWAASQWLGWAWRQAKPFVPRDSLEELRGVADGSGVPLRDLYELHAIPDRTYACSGFAAWGPMTADGRLIHTRNLDWNIHAGIQEYATVFVMQPAGKHAVIGIGWAGFIGVLSGLNDAQLSIGQIGAETADATYQGEPMVFLMRRVLEEAETLDEAIEIIRQARRTVGVNYLVADAKAKRAVAIETTRDRAQVFEANDPKEHGVPYARPMPHAVLRADPAMDPAIRARQLASHGDPRRPGLEDPVGSSAYDVRYLGQVAGLEAHRGRLDPARARAIMRAVAPGSNVQSVIFAWPELFVANAQGTERAADTTYHRLDVRQLFEGLQE